MRNLEKLANYLETLPEEQFDIWDLDKCVLYHAAVLFGIKYNLPLADFRVRIAKKLRVTRNVISSIYISKIIKNGKELTSASKSDVVTLLRHLANGSAKIKQNKTGYPDLSFETVC